MLNRLELSMRRSLKNSSAGKKIGAKFQADYLLLIAKMMKNGFSLNQTVRCLTYLDKRDHIFESIYEDLQKGRMISQALRHLKLPQIVQNQLMIAQINGGLQQTLEQCGNILKSKAKQHAKLRELLAYPIFILGFLVLMMVGMKVYILPQLGTTESGGQLDLFTKIGGLILVVTSIIAGIFMVKVKHQNEYQRAQTLIKLPLLSESYLNFYQYSILQSWGMQFSKGMDLQKICQNNQEFPQGSIQNVLATNLLNSLVKGISFQDVIEQEKLLPNELKLIFYLGAGGEEMATDILLIAELKYQQTQASIKKLLRLVQPLLFGVIAVFILIAYLMILLPVYGMMKGLN